LTVLLSEKTVAKKGFPRFFNSLYNQETIEWEYQRMHPTRTVGKMLKAWPIERPNDLPADAVLIAPRSLPTRSSQCIVTR